MKKTFFFVFVLILQLLWNVSGLLAQDKSVEMADAMRADGKIYVVVATLGLVLAGIIYYLIRLDLKIQKLEKDK